jgi:uncharacterized protein (DUF433 family)
LLDEQGRAWVDDTNVKVIEVVLDKIGFGMTPEEIHEEHYRRLSLAQVHAALAYYYDHQADFDAEVERQAKEVEQLRDESLDSPIRQKLRTLGKLP